MPDSIVKVSHVSKSFESSRGFGSRKRRVHAVNDVSFEIRPGETFSLVGESGCGKSTTGRLINQMIRPDSGTISFGGRDLAALSEKELRAFRKDVQMIFQDPYGSLNPRIRIRDQVAEPLLLHTDLSGEERLEQVGDLLRQVGLSPGHGERYPHEFSGGQLQRIGIARAISVHPRLIIADEPVSALDVSIQAQVLNLMRELQEKLHLSYLFISHDLSVVEMISDRIAVMYLGTIVETADRTSLYQRPLHPYTRALLSAVPVPDPSRKRQRILLQGDIPSPWNPPSGCLFHTRCPHCEARCRTEKPELKSVETGHQAACHFAEEFLAGQKSLRS